MIEIELLLAFAAAAFAVIVIPGPTVLLVTSYSLSGGFRIALLSIVGVCLGDTTAMALTFLGLGAIMATSAELFMVLKWVGAGYLIFLGIELWRAPVATLTAEGQQESRTLRIIGRAFTVNVLHPKGLAFFSAFLPQFISPASPALPQMLILGCIFVAIGCCVLLAYAWAASRFCFVLTRPRIRHIANRTGATCLVGAGLYTLSMHKGG